MKAVFPVVVRGGGDLATGTIHKLHQAGIPLLVLEAEHPSAIRRYVSYCEAVYEGRWTVEETTAVQVKNLEEAAAAVVRGEIPVLVDPRGAVLRQFRPQVLIDAILAKTNLGTTKEMAELVIGLGPGFTAGEDVHLVVETQRGHRLGRVITQGTAAANTGVPGIIGGYGKERVIHSPAEGKVHCQKAIGDLVHQGEIIARVGDVSVAATIDGVLRGLIREGYPVTRGFKMADIDPRLSEQKNCFTISDKARCIAGGVLEGMLHYAPDRQGLWRF